MEQLILIGDHKQLQPKPATMEISRRYNLRTSLFERLVHNRVALESLQMQHRMRPEIADLVRWIYSSDADKESDGEVASPCGLVDHDSVTHCEHVRGVADTISSSFITKCPKKLI